MVEEVKMNYMKLFAIKSREEMRDYLESFSDKKEKALAYTIYGLTWNMCAKLVNGD
jgi:hypothetical protein